jgi:hypothetical protein
MPDLHKSSSETLVECAVLQTYNDLLLGGGGCVVSIRNVGGTG